MSQEAQTSNIRSEGNTNEASVLPPLGNRANSDGEAAKVMQQSPADFYWQWGLHENHMYINRNSYILVAEAMLFAAMAQLRVSANIESRSALPVIYGLGTFITLIWMAINYRQLVHTDKFVRRKIAEHVPLWKAVDDLRPKQFIGIRVMTGFFLPLGLLIAWVVLWVVV